MDDFYYLRQSDNEDEEDKLHFITVHAYPKNILRSVRVLDNFKQKEMIQEQKKKTKFNFDIDECKLNNVMYGS